MWHDRLRISDSVAHDWRSLNGDERATARGALRMIDDNPIAGAPLFEPLKGLWSCRVGNLRIVYRIVTEGRFIVILSITKCDPRLSAPPASLS